MQDSPDILIVDDEASVVEVVGLYLKKDGYQVRSARNGLEALTSIRDRPPDLVVLDLMLPKIDGIEVMRRIREELVEQVPVKRPIAFMV